MKILKIVGTSLCVLIMVVSGCALLLLHWSAFGWKTLDVPTGSMRPTIPPSSLVFVHRVPAKSLKVGDVITYVNPLSMKTTITHRIVKESLLSSKVPVFTTKGDANKVADVPVVSGLVQGKVIWHVPYAGAWLAWSKTWLGISLLVYVPALLIMVEEVRRLSAYYRLQQPYKLPGFGRLARRSRTVSPRVALAGSLSLVFVLVGAFLWQPALALLRSNTVMLSPNHLAVVKHLKPPTNTTSCSNTTTVSVGNSSSQTAASGNASGNSANSGNASNSNSSGTTVTVTGC